MFRQAAAFTPRPHEQRHQRPLRTARILKFVDQHMLVSALEPIPAARELVHLREQRQGARQRFGKVDHAMRIQRALVFGERDGVDTSHAARQHGVQVAAEDLERAGDVASDPLHVCTMNLPCLGRAAVFR